ncbi:MAG: type II toxin-antitoxin system HicA family toxin, partial [Candidatus Omnitrophica bacterium]|nr:type II toxin-antitoxin system HicA family toxin [Candidatus Omnitrophota bacterium]
SQRDFIRILKENGFIQTSQRGSHRFWKKPGFRVTVDIKYSEYSGWLLNKMIEQSGLPKSIFRKQR